LTYQTPDLRDRLVTSAAAKKATLEKFRSRPGPDDPAVRERREAREAIVKAREVRKAQQELARQEREAAAVEAAAAEAVRVAKMQEEEAKLALLLAAEQAEKDAALAAAQKAARDARYAARKAAKKERRRGY
jgi:hypothetical protein